MKKVMQGGPEAASELTSDPEIREMLVRAQTLEPTARSCGCCAVRLTRACAVVDAP
jgi:hypothetical protein